MSLRIYGGSRTVWFALSILIVFGANVAAQKRIVARNQDNVINPTFKPQDDIDDFVPYQGERNNQFDWELMKKLIKSHSGNLLMSPISLKFALVLLYEGAQGATAKELATAMNLPNNVLATRMRFASMLQSLKENNPDYTLNFGSRVYVDSNVTLRQRYRAMAETFYKTEVLNVNFSDTQTTSKLINKFVSDVTEGHIPQLIGDDSDLKDDIMMIVNTLYFKGKWFNRPFSGENTRIGAFNTRDGKTVSVPYMVSNKKFYLAYAKEIDAKILRLPYAGHKYSMFIVLPQQQRANLSDLMDKLSPNVLNRYMWIMEETKVDLKLPKFKFDFTVHFEKILRQLGINDIFEETAMLTGILRSKSTPRRLVVTDIVQKSGIEVNEQGSTIYTATEIEIGTKMSDEAFHATQPFLFYIEDESTGTILHMGVVNNPLEQTGIAADTNKPSKPLDDRPVLIPPRAGSHI